MAALLSVLSASATGSWLSAQAPRNDDSHPSMSPDGVKVVFQSRRAGSTDLFLMRFDGSFPVRLTQDAGENREPEWSPSGEQIVFQSNRSGSWQLWVMAADGSEQTRVTDLEGGAQAPSFSPDGERIVFITPVDGVPQVMEVTLADRSVRRLTSSPGAKSQPTLSPEGSWLGFVSDASGRDEIHVADASGASERQLTRFATDEPRRFVNGLGWTPEAELLFGANRDGRGRYFFKTDIFTMRPDGTALRRIVSGPGNHNNPSMARNGSRIAFDAFRFGGADVFVVDSDGSNQRNLTATSQANFFPVPTPDGERVVFQSQRDGNREIYVMGRDGNDVRNLTGHPTDDRAPSMAADGELVVFASFRDSEWGDIYTMDVTGGKLTKVTPDGFFERIDQFPISTAVTPDGETILFESAPVLVEGEAHWDIWRIDRDGSNATRLTSSPGTTRAAAPSVSPDGTQFVYYSDATGDSEIYRMAIEGGTPEQLTAHEGPDYYPTWSADGGWIYFTSTRGGNPDVYRMTSGGSNVAQVTQGSSRSSHYLPRVDAAGRNLWVASNMGGGTEVHRLDLDGTHEVALTAPWGPTAEDTALSRACTTFTQLGQPHWSWTRNQIAFPGDCDGNRTIYLYDVEADWLTGLDIDLEGLDSPAWSTRGDRIAFNAEDDAGERDMYTYEVASGKVTRITHGGVHGGWVTWSPDDRFLNGYSRDANGSWMVVRISVESGEASPLHPPSDTDEFTLAESPRGGVFLYSSARRIRLKEDGGPPRPVTPKRFGAVMPRWAPDGERFVFDGNHGWGWDLFLGDLQGAEPLSLTRRPLTDSNGTWSPDGKTVVYRCTLEGNVASLCLLDVPTRRGRPLFRPTSGGSSAPERGAVPTSQQSM